MSRELLRRAFLVIPLGLATLAGCKDTDTTAPRFAPSVPFAQGAGGVWTVNVLTDPGDGVCDDTNCTLREAISAAASGDQVVFASGLQGSIALVARLTIAKSLSVNGSGRITLDAATGFNVMDIIQISGSPALTVALDGLTMRNGNTSFDGGGLWITGTTAVTIRNSTISGNTSQGHGGAIRVDQRASLTLFNSALSGNRASGDGGGIWSDGTLTLTNSTVDGNTANNGGGILNQGTLSVVGSTISDNEATLAAGIANATGGSATVERSTISGNRSGNSVGGISNGGTLALRSATVSRNDGGSGIGGLFFSGSSTTVANSIIVGNIGSFADDCGSTGGTAISLGHNLSGCNFSATGDIKVTAAQAFTEVLEQVLKDNGGPTRTHALIARGRAVDAGYCPGETADQRGFTRPVDDATMPNAVDACDIGAYEAQGPQVAVADLMVSQTVNKSNVKQGELLTYTVRVQNLGPQTAPNVVMNNVLSSGVTFVEARHNNGTITAPPKGETGTVTWNIGDMANQSNEVVEIQVTVLVRGKTTITNTATVSGNVADPNPANNSAAITVSVAPGSSCKKP